MRNHKNENKEMPEGSSMSLCKCGKTFFSNASKDWKENHIKASMELEDHFRKEHELN
jgi:hypothetical protein